MEGDIEVFVYNYRRGFGSLGHSIRRVCNTDTEMDMVSDIDTDSDMDSDTLSYYSAAYTLIEDDIIYQIEYNMEDGTIHNMVTSRDGITVLRHYYFTTDEQFYFIRKNNRTIRFAKPWFDGDFFVYRKIEPTIWYDSD